MKSYTLLILSLWLVQCSCTSSENTIGKTDTDTSQTDDANTQPQGDNTKDSYAALEVISYAQIERFDSFNFELSGIVAIDDEIYVVADKPRNSFLYQIKLENNGWQVTEQTPLNIDERLDLEAVDCCGAVIYLANEYSGKVYSVEKGIADQLVIDFSDVNQDVSSWGNAGWEGLAMDCENDRLFLIKERQPRIIFIIDLKTNQVVDQFDIPHTESNDFADAKYENGFLYLLERNGAFVTKVDVSTHEVIAKYHYKKEASFEYGKLYQEADYGMAEALLMTKGEVWIGWDNNGREVTEHAKSKYELTGNMPVIFKFKRPDGF